MFAVAVSITVLALLVVILLMVELRHYRAGRRLISRRRFVLRLVTGLLMLSLLGAVFVGLFVLRLTEARSNPSLFLGFWFGCIMIAVVLAGVMVADLREVGDQFTQRQHQIWRDMARFIADGSKGGEHSEAGSPPGDAASSEEKE